MTTPMIRLPGGGEAPEGLCDTVLTSLCALHDIRGLGSLTNSRAGSIYIVKPKQHGPEECAFTNRAMNAAEDLLGLPRHTIKEIGNASCRARGCTYVSSTGGAVSLKTNVMSTKD